MLFLPFLVHQLQFQQILHKEIFTSKADTCNDGVTCSCDSGTVTITAGSELTSVTCDDETTITKIVLDIQDATDFTFGSGFSLPQDLTVEDNKKSINTIRLSSGTTGTTGLTLSNFESLTTIAVNTEASISISGVPTNAVFQLESSTITFGTIGDISGSLPIKLTETSHSVTFPDGFDTVEIKGFASGNDVTLTKSGGNNINTLRLSVGTEGTNGLKLSNFESITTIAVKTTSPISISGVPENAVFQLEETTIVFGTIGDISGSLPIKLTGTSHSVTFPDGFDTVEIKGFEGSSAVTLTEWGGTINTLRLSAGTVGENGLTLSDFGSLNTIAVNTGNPVSISGVPNDVTFKLESSTINIQSLTSTENSSPITTIKASILSTSTYESSDITLGTSIKITSLEVVGSEDNGKKLSLQLSTVFDSLESITLRDITTIGTNSFSGIGSSRQVSVTIPSTVETIEGGAFKNCAQIQLTVDPSNFNYDSDENAFYKQTDGSLYYVLPIKENFNVKEGTTIIGQSACLGNTVVNTIVLPDTVEEIQESAFSGCTSLSSISISSTVTIKDSTSFQGCTQLQTLNLYKGTGTTPISFTLIPALTTIHYKGDWSESVSPTLTIKLNIEFDEDFSIPDNFLKDSQNVGDVDFSNVESIGVSAFSGSSLTKISIPSTIWSISSQAFVGCKLLTEVSLSCEAFINDVSQGASRKLYRKLRSAGIASDAFNIEGNPTSVKKLTLSGYSDSQVTISISKLFGSDSITEVIISQASQIRSGSLTGLSNLVTLKLPRNLRQIEGGSFVGSPKVIPEVDEDNTYLTYSNDAFYSLNNNGGENKLDILLTAIPRTDVTTFNIPEGVITIGPKAFEGCSYKTVTIPETVREIQSEAFVDCSQLTTINFAGTRCAVADDVFDSGHQPTVHVPPNYEKGTFGDLEVKKDYDPDNPPEEPDKPEEPDNPEEPGNPDDPENPDKPVDPDDPDKPEKPNQPDNPDKPGDDDDDGLSGGAIAAIVIAVLVVVAVAAFCVYYFFFRKPDNVEDAEVPENEDVEVGV